MQEHRYRAFLCYSHRDSAWADWLHDALETYAIPPRLVGLATAAGTIPPHLRPVFRDRDELPSASDLSTKVRDALAQSACLIVICSPHAAQSRWVDEEVRTFQRLGRGHRIYCLIVDGEPGASTWPGREHDECLPPALKSRDDGANAETIEPIAADARPSGDGKANAKLKLIAGLLGVGLDDLRHRERRRRRWRRLIAGAAALALLCLTTTLAVNAVIARHAAERRQKQAEDLVGFMLGDLDDKLREVNRLDILESVADKVVDYFAALPLADMSDDALAQRAKTLQKLGHLRFDQGRLADAGIALDKAEATSRELLQRDGRREAYCVLLAQTLSWKGRIAWTRGDLDAALAKFREAAKVLDSRRPSEPADDTRAADLVASVHTNIGRVEEAQGDVDHARQEYEFVLRMYEQLVAREPDHLEWKTELGYAHNNLGQLAWNEGRLAKAIDEYSADRRIKSSLSLLAPQDNSRREDLLISNAILGNALFSIGEITMARRYVESAVVDARKLIAIDSNVTGWQEDAGYYEMMLVAILRAQGHLEEASRTADSALTRFRDLVAKDPANAQWLRELVDSETEAARTLLARSSLAGASNTISGALVHARALHEKDPSGSRVSRTIARAQMIAGDVAAAAGHRDDSLKVWRTAEGILQSSAKDRSPAWLELDASIMLRLEKNKLAQESVARLAEMGDRHPDLVADLSSRGMSFPTDNSSRSVIDAAVAGIRKFDGVAAAD